MRTSDNKTKSNTNEIKSLTSLLKVFNEMKKFYTGILDLYFEQKMAGTFVGTCE